MASSAAVTRGGAGLPLRWFAARASRRSASTRPIGGGAAGAGALAFGSVELAAARTTCRGGSGGGATYGAGAGAITGPGGFTVSSVATRPSTVNTVLGLQHGHVRLAHARVSTDASCMNCMHAAYALLR